MTDSKTGTKGCAVCNYNKCGQCILVDEEASFLTDSSPKDCLFRKIRSTEMAQEARLLRQGICVIPLAA
jgi:hypothetical protein